MRALILGGGGTLGAFSAGALEALQARGWQPDILIGSSAGGINLLRSSVGGAKEAAAFWSGLDWKTLLWKSLTSRPGNGGVLSEEDMYRRVEERVSFEALFHDARVFGFLVVDLGSGAVSVRGNRTERTPEELRLVSRAAYALPPLLPPVRHGDRLLADGGFLHNAPLEYAASLGATEIVYLCNVQVLPHEGYRTPSTIPSTARYLDIFFRRASNVGFADAQVVEHVWNGIPILVIAPPSTRGLSSIFRFMVPSKKGLRALIKLGRLRAKQAIDHFETTGAGLGWAAPRASLPADGAPKSDGNPSNGATRLVLKGAG